jgi:hypothetical protein
VKPGWPGEIAEGGSENSNGKARHSARMVALGHQQLEFEDEGAAK